MTSVSWHPGCPVGFDRLRLLKLSVWGFDGRVHRGRLVVNEDATRPMLTAMHRLFDLRPDPPDAAGRRLRRRRRPQYGSRQHLGLQLPLRRRKGARFADRSRRAKGLIHPNGPVVAAFAAVGWGWGGNWQWPKDLQHFSASGS